MAPGKSTIQMPSRLYLSSKHSSRPDQMLQGSGAFDSPLAWRGLNWRRHAYTGYSVPAGGLPFWLGESDPRRRQTACMYVFTTRLRHKRQESCLAFHSIHMYIRCIHSTVGARAHTTQARDMLLDTFHPPTFSLLLTYGEASRYMSTVGGSPTPFSGERDWCEM